MTLEVPRWAGALWFVAWATASSVWCLSAAPRLGATFDEPTYIAAGLDRWRDGTIGGLMRLGTMPLPVDVVTLPLWIEERWTGERFRIGTDGRGRVIESADLPRVLPIARATTLVFWWILLAAGWRLGSQLAGPWGARLAVAFLAVEPSLLAHATLATTDIALTAFLLAFAASLAKYRNNAALHDVSSQGAWGDQGGKLTGRSGRSRSFSFSPWRPALIPGIWFGLALLSKASALVFAPLIALCVLAPRVRSGDWPRAARTLLRVTAIAIAIAFIYCGSDWRRDESFVEWARALPDSAIATGLRTVADHLPIFSNAGEGLVQQVKHNIRGHGAYLLGREYPRAVWFYFPVVLLIKTSSAILVALLAIVLLRRDALAGNWLLGAAALIVLLSPAFRVQTGVRMILPALALAIVGLAAALVCAAAAARYGGQVRAAGSRAARVVRDRCVALVARRASVRERVLGRP